MLERTRRRPAFSLVELLAVVTVLALLAVLVLPRVTNGIDLAGDRTCVSNCGHIHSAVERYRQATGSWPSADLNELDGNLDYFPSGLPTCPVTGEAYRIETAGDLYRVPGHPNGNHSP